MQVAEFARDFGVVRYRGQPSVKDSLTLFSLPRGGNHGLCIETERVRLTF